MKKLFPKVFTVKVRIPSFLFFVVVGFPACAGINSVIKWIGFPELIEILLVSLCTLYFIVYIGIAFLNLIGIIRVQEE